MNFKYLSVATLIRINAAQEGDVGVREIEGIEANAARPQAGYAGHDKFDDVWTKAAAYAHGIASTQYFMDGNKRTAWLAANIFLDAHGYELPEISDIDSEVFIIGCPRRMEGRRRRCNSPQGRRVVPIQVRTPLTWAYPRPPHRLCVPGLGIVSA